MDEIEYKLGTNNPILISHAISKLLCTIKEKHEADPTADISKAPELKLLWSKCSSTNITLGMTACQAIIALVEIGVIDINNALYIFISHLGTLEKHTAIAAALSNLLILNSKSQSEGEQKWRFGIKGPQHPLISILNNNKSSWRNVLSYMQFMIQHKEDEIAQRSLELLKPVFLYILCNPTPALPEIVKHQAWHILIKSKNTQTLQCEILQWLRTNDINNCAETSNRLLELAQVKIISKDKQFCNVLMPLIISITGDLVKEGFNPKPSLDMMLELAEYSDNDACNITVSLLAEMIITCPPIYLCSVIESCAVLLQKLSCSRTVAFTLVACILKWMAYPSVLLMHTLDIAKNLVQNIVNKKAWGSSTIRLYSNEVFIKVYHTDKKLQFYSEICRCVDTLSEKNTLEWLTDVAAAPQDVKNMCILILSGLFLQSENPTIIEKIIDILINISKEKKDFASHLLSLVLYKLTKTRNIDETKTLMFILPDLALVKENVPIIIHALESLIATDKPLKQLAIELYLKALENEPRCRRYLLAVLIDTSKKNHGWQSDIACARAMCHICETKPENGAELVPLLSEILNRCSNVNGSAASALALKGISALCVAGVIDISSTYRVLSPKLNKESRKIVLKSVCEFFGDIPLNPQSIQTYEKLVTEIVTKLWGYVSSSGDSEIMESALKALSAYQLEHIPLKSLAVEFRENLVMPKEYAKTPMEAARNPADVLPYIPRECWMQMLTKINRTVLECAGDLLIAFITREIKDLPSSIYSQNEPFNFEYLSEKSVIRAIGENLRCYKVNLNSDNRSVVECLRIFAHKYVKPLPPVNWTFLKKIMELSIEAKKYSVIIACQQSKTCTSARAIVEEYLKMFESDTVTMIRQKEYLSIYSNMDYLCKAIPPNVLRPFLDTTLNYIVEKALPNTDDLIDEFREMMICYRKTLQNKTIHDANRTLLSIILEGILERLDVDSKVFALCMDAALELSSTHIERMTSPSVWWEVTAQKLKKAIIIRSELALKKDVETPLVWLNEVIDAVTSVPGSLWSGLPSYKGRIIDNVTGYKNENISISCGNPYSENTMERYYSPNHGMVELHESEFCTVTI
ncbi:focadhesin isoform X2 [Orussus abietinus]|uniref:focadhesin isoform X2 n=1 Tax=Orussus abietinus TaxID=222816 RepID=UPI000625A35A|nr:focadhesin isoform X2 [Orussus abietinus]